MNKGDLKDFSWQKYVDWMQVKQLVAIKMELKRNLYEEI